MLYGKKQSKGVIYQTTHGTSLIKTGSFVYFEGKGKFRRDATRAEISKQASFKPLDFFNQWEISPR